MSPFIFRFIPVKTGRFSWVDAANAVCKIIFLNDFCSKTIGLSKRVKSILGKSLTKLQFSLKEVFSV